MANLSFTEKFPWGAETKFKEKIRAGYKRHTIRALKHPTKPRWAPGDRIHFWMGSVRSGKATRFNLESIIHAPHWVYESPEKPGKWIPITRAKLRDIIDLEGMSYFIPEKDPHDFCLPAVSATEIIELAYEHIGFNWYMVHIKVGSHSEAIIEWGRITDDLEAGHSSIKILQDDIGVLMLSENDGFDSIHHFMEWFFRVKNECSRYRGQIIHWQEPEKTCYEISSASILECKSQD